MISSLMTKIKSATADCQFDQNQLDRYEKAEHTLKHPKTFIYNAGKDIIFNGK